MARVVGGLIVLCAIVLGCYCIYQSQFTTVTVADRSLGMVTRIPVGFEKSAASFLAPGSHRISKGQYFTQMKLGGEYQIEHTTDVIPSKFGKWAQGARKSRFIIHLIPGAADLAHGEPIEHLMVPIQVRYRFPDDVETAKVVMSSMPLFATELSIAVGVDSAVGLYGAEILAAQGGGGLLGKVRRGADIVAKVLPGEQQQYTMTSEALADRVKQELESLYFSSRLGCESRRDNDGEAHELGRQSNNATRSIPTAQAELTLSEITCGFCGALSPRWQGASSRILLRHVASRPRTSSLGL